MSAEAHEPDDVTKQVSPHWVCAIANANLLDARASSWPSRASLVLHLCSACRFSSRILLRLLTWQRTSLASSSADKTRGVLWCRVGGASSHCWGH